MDRISRTLIMPLFVLAASACASSNVPGGSQRTAIGDPDVITREELEESVGSRNAYDLIQTIRPQWLITRGLANLRQAAGEEDIVVYMDNGRMGTREALRRIPLGGVRYLQFYDARRATQRWGGGHIHGAIFVSTQER